MTPEHASGTASAWIRRWSHLVPANGRVLDVACGHGRHMRWFAARGHPVVGVDRSRDALGSLADLVATGSAETFQADIENSPWPLLQPTEVCSGVNDLRPRQFEAVVVTNYLWRPLLATIKASVAPGGVLLYETFAAGNASVGKPSRADFLLAQGELVQVCSGLHIVAYEDGYCDDPARFIQRIAAVRKPDSVAGGSAVTPLRFTL